MINLPRWVQKILEESVCVFCKKKMRKEGVYAVGVSEEISAKTHQPYLSFFYNYHCHLCKKKSTCMGFPTNFEDFIGDMVEISNAPSQNEEKGSREVLEGPQQTPQAGQKKPTADSGISEKELSDVKKLLKDSEYHEDFLTKLGMNKNELKKLRKAHEQDK